METLLDRPTTAAVRQPAASLTWPLAAAVLGTTSIVVGLLWDISWHATIGRDTFWTPAHLALYLGGILCGASAGWVALATTFGDDAAQRAVAVRFWGFRAPLGAWVAIWGAIAMLTSAPFDDWWHNAYGLDVRIISPPHVLLAAGILAIQLGAMLLALSAQNRVAATAGAAMRLPALAYAYAAGLLLVILSTLFLEYSEPNRQHGALYYEISCAAYPLILVGAARAARLRWPATTVAGIYMAVRLAMTWILPLFPATPMLAPITNPVHHMWPLFWPQVLVLPALAIDLLLRRAGATAGSGGPGSAAAAAVAAGHSDPSEHAAVPSDSHSPSPPGSRRRGFLGANPLLLAAALGAAFLAVFLAVHWFFAEFLLTPYARNWLFAADQWTYHTRIGPWRNQFWLDGDRLGAAGILLSLAFATASARLGIAWGGWMARVRR
jgi:hypothetical protein